MTQELAFHLGDCKTGTTSIQHALAHETWEAEGQSVVYPTVVNHLPLALCLQDRPEARQKARRWNDLQRRLGASKAHLGVISAEQFEFVDPLVLRDAIDKHLPEFSGRIRMIAYVRPHADRLVSTFAERTKKGDCLAQMARLHKKLERKKLFYYAPRFERWRELFGENFTLRPMIRDRLDQGDVVADFFGWLFQGAPFRLTGKRDANESLTLEELAMMREIHKQIRGAKQRELIEAQRALGWNIAPLLASANPGVGTKPRLHKALAEDVVDTYRADAERLDAEFFDGTPMTEALLKAPDKAVDEAQSTRAKDHFPPEAVARMQAFGTLFARLMEADPRFFMRAARPPEQRRSEVTRDMGDTTVTRLSRDVLGAAKTRMETLAQRMPD